MFKRKRSERTYKVETLGGLIIEQMQLPSSLQKQDGTVYELMAYEVRLRVEDGPILFSRGYVEGTEEAIAAIPGRAKYDTRVEGAWECKHEFYQELAKAWGFYR